jgi:hypothetical protein
VTAALDCLKRFPEHLPVFDRDDASCPTDHSASALPCTSPC